MDGATGLIPAACMAGLFLLPWFVVFDPGRTKPLPTVDWLALTLVELGSGSLLIFFLYLRRMHRRTRRFLLGQCIHCGHALSMERCVRCGHAFPNKNAGAAVKMSADHPGVFSRLAGLYWVALLAILLLLGRRLEAGLPAAGCLVWILTLVLLIVQWTNESPGYVEPDRPEKLDMWVTLALLGIGAGIMFVVRLV
jgi:hypothetical protein